MSVEFDELNRMRENPTEEASNMVEFSDEEGYGKYLDLHECYEKYINLKGVEVRKVENTLPCSNLEPNVQSWNFPRRL